MNKKYLNLTIFICFVQIISGQTPQQIIEWLPDAKGWRASETVDVFVPDNLFDHLGKEAHTYFENNFRELTCVNYIKDGETIAVEVYRHATPEDAFGMYASERSHVLRQLPIGGEAQGNYRKVNFFVDNLYVKMQSNSLADENILQDIARKFAENVNPNSDYPPIIKAFPQQGKIPYTESYITANYLGHAFLRHTYTALYKKGEQEFMAIIIDAKTKEEAKKMISQYLAYYLQPLDFKEGFITVKNKDNDDVPLLWQGRFVFGMVPEKREYIKNYALFLTELSENVFSIEYFQDER